MKKNLIDYLSKFATDERNARISAVIAERTNYLTVVLEDIFQPQNASAVIRTCDCLGIQNIHVIQNRNTYQINPDVVLGSSQWVTINKYKKKAYRTEDVIMNLKNNGYRVIATSPHQSGVLLNDFDLFKGKCAIMFGTELTGLSDTALELADEYLKIPIYGFTESYNISVSVAIILYQLISQLKQSEIDWHLNEKDRNAVLLDWYKSSVKSADMIIERFHTFEK